jgi:hypothetical protein
MKMGEESSMHWKTINAHKVLVEKSEGKLKLRRFKQREKNSILRNY